MADQGYPDIKRDGGGPRVAASPVNTFVQPQTPQVIGENRLISLAKSLTPISNELRAWAHTRDTTEAEAERLRGQAAFYANNSEGYEEGVRRWKETGEGIPPTASPQFVAGYKRTQGDVEGNRLTQRFQSTYMAWDGKETADDATFNEMLAGFLKQNVTTTDPDILRGLMPHIQALHGGARRMFNADRNEAFYKGYLDTATAQAAQLVDEYSLAGVALPTGTDYKGLWDAIVAQRSEAGTKGLRLSDYDKKIIDMVTAKTIATKDHQLLGLLDNFIPGTETRYSDLPAGRDAKLATETKLESMVHAAEARLNSENIARKKLEIESSERELVGFITRNPTGAIPEDILARADKADPLLRVRSVEWRKALNSGMPEDDAEIVQVYRDVLAGRGTKSVLLALDKGIITSPATFQKVYDWAKSTTGNDKLGEVLKGVVVKNTLDTIRQRTLPPDIFDLKFDPGGMSNEGYRLSADYQLQLLDWARQHPDAGLYEISEAQQRIGTQVILNINGGKGPQAPGEVRRSPEAEALEPSALPMRPKATPPSR